MYKEIDMIADIDEYLDALARLDNHIIIAAAKDTLVPGSLISNLTDEEYSKLNKIGLAKLTPDNVEDQFWCGYICVVVNHKTIYEDIVLKDEAYYHMKDNGLELSILSSPHKKQNKSCIIVNGEELSVCKRGLDIVVIDEHDYSFVDSVAIDTWKDNKITRLNTIGKNKIADADASVLADIMSRLDKLEKYIKKQSRTIEIRHKALLDNSKKQELLLWANYQEDGEDLYKTRKRFFNTLPVAEEPLRTIQKGGLTLLRYLDKVCVEHNIPYWVTNGTLLGAVRHTGFIPWDDDVDICILREDFEALKDVMKGDESFELVESFKMVGPQTKYIVKKCFLKPKLKNDVNLYMDIFIIDYGDDNARQDIEKFNALRKEFITDFWSRGLKEAPVSGNNRCVEIFKGNEAYQLYEAFYQSYRKRYDVLLGDKSQKKCLIWAIDNADFWFGKKRVFEYDWIFPLRRIQFEDIEVNAPNDFDTVLRFFYGEWLNLPDDMHTHFTTSQENLNIIKDFIKSHNN